LQTVGFTSNPLQPSHFEIGGDKRISQHLSGQSSESRMGLPYSLNLLSVTLEGSLEEIPFHCDRIFGNIFRRDKLQIIWFVALVILRPESLRQ
jgi:hypothetical protein